MSGLMDLLSKKISDKLEFEKKNLTTYTISSIVHLKDITRTVCLVTGTFKMFSRRNGLIEMFDGERVHASGFNPGFVTFVGDREP